MLDVLLRKVAHLLPRRVVYFAAIRVWVYASAGRHKDQSIDTVLMSQAVRRWDEEDN